MICVLRLRFFVDTPFLINSNCTSYNVVLLSLSLWFASVAEQKSTTLLVQKSNKWSVCGCFLTPKICLLLNKYAVCGISIRTRFLKEAVFNPNEAYNKIIIVDCLPLNRYFIFLFYC